MDVSLDRRHLLTVGISTAACWLAQPSEAARFVDRTGLSTGRFIWEPTQPAEGPVVILVSVRDRLAHVYKNGALVGISKCRLGSRRIPSGIFELQNAPRRDFVHHASGTPDGQQVVWTGVTLHAFDAPRGANSAQGLFRLPSDFARLLSTIIQPGTIVVAANTRTEVRNVAHTEPFGAGASLELSTDRGRVGHFGLAISKAISSNRPQIPCILISTSNRQASVLRDGQPGKTVPIAVNEGDGKLGTQVYSLLGVSQKGQSLRWLALGIAKRRYDPLLAKWQGDALDRISFINAEDAAVIKRELRVGTTLIVTDQPTSRVQRANPRGQLILVSDKPNRSTRVEPAIEAM